MSIDESMHAKDSFTFFSNKDGHGKKGILVAVVRGTKASEVVSILMKIPEDKRLAVNEVTMDYSDSIYYIVTQVFPNASIAIDCFHIMKKQCNALDCIRIRLKRKAIAEHKTRRRRKSIQPEEEGTQGGKIQIPQVPSQET